MGLLHCSPQVKTRCLGWILGFKCGEKNAESLEDKEEAEFAGDPQC